MARWTCRRCAARWLIAVARMARPAPAASPTWQPNCSSSAPRLRAKNIPYRSVAPALEALAQAEIPFAIDTLAGLSALAAGLRLERP